MATMRHHKLQLLAVYLFVLALVSCSSGGTALAPPDEAPASGFELVMLSDGAGGEAPRCTLEIKPGDDETVAAVILQEEWNTGTLYFDLNYDAGVLSPISAEPLVTAGKAESLVHLAVLSDRGVVHYGQVPRGGAALSPRKAGDVLVEARFEHRPCAARVTSQPPTGISSQVQLRDTARGQLFWYYTNNGDYNNDGIVNIYDIAPVGKHFGDIAEDSHFRSSDVRLIVDGNSDGVINIADLTALGQNWGNSVIGGYKIYYSNSMRNYPTYAHAENGQGTKLFHHIGFSQREQSWYPSSFTMDIDPAVAGAIFWVRPLDADEKEGIASTYVSNIGLRVPRIDEAGAHAWWDGDSKALKWYFTNPGDFMQDGEVTIGDIKMISYHYNEVSPGGVGTPFPEDDVCFIIDYDSNGIIEEKDWEAIWQYNGNVVRGYNIYESTDESNYPSSNDEVTTQLPVCAQIGVYEAWCDPCYERRSFSYTPDYPVPGYCYWVRPYDYMGNEGTPSNLVVIPE